MMKKLFALMISAAAIGPAVAGGSTFQCYTMESNAVRPNAPKWTVDTSNSPTLTWNRGGEIKTMRTSGGGNGVYWRTAVDADNPSGEVRFYRTITVGGATVLMFDRAVYYPGCD